MSIVSNWTLTDAIDSSGNGNTLTTFVTNPDNRPLSVTGNQGANNFTATWTIPAATFPTHFSFEFYIRGFVDGGIVFSTPTFKVWQKLVNAKELIVIEGTGFNFGVIIDDSTIWNHFKANIPLILGTDVKLAINGQRGVSYNWPSDIAALTFDSTTLTFGSNQPELSLSDVILYDSEVICGYNQEYKYFGNSLNVYNFQETTAFDLTNTNTIIKRSSTDLTFDKYLDGVAEYYTIPNNNSKNIQFKFDISDATLPINIISQEDHFTCSINISGELEIKLSNYASSATQTLSGNRLFDGINSLEIVSTKFVTIFTFNGKVFNFAHVDNTLAISNGDIILGVSIDITTNIHQTYSSFRPISLILQDSKKRLATNYIKTIHPYDFGGSVSSDILIPTITNGIQLLSNFKDFNYSSEISILFSIRLVNFVGTQNIIFVSDVNDLGIKLEFTTPNLVLTFGSGTINFNIGNTTETKNIAIIKDVDKLQLFVNFVKAGEILQANYPATQNTVTSVELSKNTSLYFSKIEITKYIISPFYKTIGKSLGYGAISNSAIVFFQDEAINISTNIVAELSTEWTLVFEFEYNNDSIYPINMFELNGAGTTLKFIKDWGQNRLLIEKDGIVLTTTISSANVVLNIVKLSNGTLQIFKEGIKIYDMVAYLLTETFTNINVLHSNLKTVVVFNTIETQNLQTNINDVFQPTLQPLSDWEFDFSGNSYGLTTISEVAAKSDIYEKMFDFDKTTSTNGYLIEFLINPEDKLRGITIPRLTKTYKISASTSLISSSAIEISHDTQEFRQISAELNESSNELNLYIDGDYISTSDVPGNFTIDNALSQEIGMFITSNIDRVRVLKGTKLVYSFNESEITGYFDFPITKFELNTDINGEKSLNDNISIDCEVVFIKDITFANQIDGVRLSHGELTYNQIGDTTNTTLTSFFYGSIGMTSTLTGNVSGTIYKNIINF